MGVWLGREWLDGLRRRIRAIVSPSDVDEVFDVGFHGDDFLIRTVELSLADSQAFVETGSNVGSTLGFVARNHPEIQCFSCEPDARSFERALETVSGCENVELFREPSRPFLTRLLERELYRHPTTFWLDAHGGAFEWPLPAEIRLISERWADARVLVDDCRVPGREWFAYDRYEGIECSPELILDNVAPSSTWRLWVPTYRERTSQHHPLRGWALLEIVSREGSSAGESPLGALEYLELHASSAAAGPMAR